MPADSEERITATLLSGKPKDESVPVALLIGMAIVLTTLLCWQNSALSRVLSASRSDVAVRHEYWRLLTTIAVHADLAHLAANMAFVLFFGYLLYGYFGFWIYPAAMLTLASLVNLLSLLTYPPDAVLIGASGLVYLMTSFWLVLYLFVERTLPLGKRLLRVVGIILIVLVPTNVRSDVSYRTHGIGFAVGGMAGVAYFLSRRTKIRSMETTESESRPDNHES